MRWRRIGPAVLAVAALALCDAVSRDDAAPAGSVLTERVVRAADATAQLASARAIEARLDGRSGRARLAVRLTAIEAFRRVHTGHVEAWAVRTVGALEAGRHLTTAGFHDEALAEFDAAVRLAPDDELRLVARRARADAARRAGAWKRAALDYGWCAERVAADERNASLVRLGEAWRRCGHTSLAEETWKRATRIGSVDRDLIEAYDRLARLALERGDDAAAAGWIEACRVAVRDSSAALTPRGEALRHGLVGMRARYELQCRVADRTAYARGATRENVRAGAWERDVGQEHAPSTSDARADDVHDGETRDDDVRDEDARGDDAPDDDTPDDDAPDNGARRDDAHVRAARGDSVR